MTVRELLIKLAEQLDDPEAEVKIRLISRDRTDNNNSITKIEFAPITRYYFDGKVGLLSVEDDTLETSREFPG